MLWAVTAVFYHRKQYIYFLCILCYFAPRGVGNLTVNGQSGIVESWIKTSVPIGSCKYINLPALREKLWQKDGPTNQPTNRPTNQSTDRQEREKLRFSNNRLLGLYTECAARNLLKAFPLKVCVYFDWCDAE